MGGFVVTAGIGVEAIAGQWAQDNNDYDSILLKALADRLAEALAENLHRRVRREYWGYAADENLPNDALIRERYRGIRPAPGYPSCPDHTEKRPLFDLLQATDHIGVALTDNLAMTPTASVSGFYYAHPDAGYFAVGKIDKVQVADMASRRNMAITELENWLRPNLDYDPDEAGR